MSFRDIGFIINRAKLEVERERGDILTMKLIPYTRSVGGENVMVR